jgi:hypothetical protein
MRIVENTPARLVLRDRPPWAGPLLLAAMGLAILGDAAYRVPLRSQWSLLLLAGVVVVLVLVRSSEAIFDKASRTCAVRRFDLGGLRRCNLAFGDIVDVAIQPSRRTGGSGAMSSRLSLVTAEAVIPLMLFDEPGPERHRIMRDNILDAVFADRPRPADANR